MTLILTKACALYAAMAVDRRLTTDGGALFDYHTNKVVVFSDKNAVVTLAYTGAAYIGERPTDVWLAETLTGLSFPEGRRGPGSAPAMMTIPYTQRYWGQRLRDLRDALDKLPARLDASSRSGWIRHPFEILGTGFEWNRGVVRPFTAALSKSGNSTTFAIAEPSRGAFRSRGDQHPVVLQIAPAENLRRNDRDDMVRAGTLPGHAVGTRAVDRTSALVGVIRSVAGRNSLVGPDATTVFIPRPIGRPPPIEIRYWPAGSEKGDVAGVDGTVRITAPVAFTPWVVSPGCIRAPSVLGSIEVRSACGPYEVVSFPIDSATGRSGGFVGSQARPRRPS